MRRYSLIILFTLLVPAGIMLGSLPSSSPAASVEEPGSSLEGRKDALLSYWANQKLPEWRGWENENSWLAKPSGPAKVHFPNIALAKLAQGEDVESINNSLANARAYSGVGSHVPLLRDGDYDFALSVLTAIAYEFWNSSRLATSTKVHLAKNLLNEEGPPKTPAYTYGFFPETENHILMTEISRYLKNQLVTTAGMQYRTKDLPESAYDNETNGMKDWLLGYLKGILANNFDEYNSKPYEVYTLSAIQALYEYAADPEVKLAAQNVLDYHALRYALQSIDLRRVVPFRRQPKHIGIDHTYRYDAGTARYALLVGNHLSVSDDQRRQLQNRARSILAVGSYEVPDMIKDLMISSSDNPYLYWSFYDNAELVHSEANFLISAGGIYHDKTSIPFFSHMDGLPRETVVMFKQGSPLISEMIRFTGAEDIEDRNNTCVFAHFACGLHPHLPEKVKANAQQVIESDKWTYLDVSNTYIAFYRDRDTTTDTPFGFLEITASDSFPSLAAFKETIDNNNGARSFAAAGENTYTTSAGVEITFQVTQDKGSGLLDAIAGLFQSEDLLWEIKDVKNADIVTYPDVNLHQWPTLQAVHLNTGEIIAHADGEGQVLANNPRYKDPLSFGITTSSSFRFNSITSSPSEGYWGAGDSTF